MPTTLAPPVAITPLATFQDLAILCLFSALGMTLSAVVLSCVSSETISMVFSSLG
jgi:hypothetical protein